MQYQETEVRERLDFIWLELTGRCNLECVHCYADSGPERPLSEGMELEHWIGALDEAAALGCRRVQFIGGEPTLYPGLPRLIEHARNIGYEQVCVYTNGTHFTDTLKAAFLANRVSLAFSVYGSSGDVHDQVTLRSGSFEKTEHAIRWAVEAGLEVRAGVVEMGVNAHDMPRTKRMLEDVGVRAINVDRLRGLGRGSGERPAQPELKELCGRCGEGKVCVSSSGEIYPCVFARFSALGQFKDGGLGAAFGGAPLREFREALIDSYATAPARRPRTSLNRLQDDCNPETPPGDCNPEKKPPDCNPEIPQGPCTPEKAASPYRLQANCSPEEPAGDCNPEIPPGDCNPETPPGRCNPEIPPPDCNPEIPQGPCTPEQSASSVDSYRVDLNRLR